MSQHYSLKTCITCNIQFIDLENLRYPFCKQCRDKRKEYQKEYRILNKDKISSYKKQYHQFNKEHINERKRENYQTDEAKELKHIRDIRYKEKHKEELRENNLEKLDCICGSKVCRVSKARHEHSKKHMEYISPNQKTS